MKKMMRRVLALALTLVMVIGLMPNITLPAVAAEQADLTVTGKVADPSSFNNWQDYYGDNALLPNGGRGTSTWKAGGVWTDKSVYESSNGFPSGVTMDNQENNFLVALSALASNQEIVGQSSTPTDTMLVLDVSGSMDDDDKAEGMVEAANRAIDALLKQNVNNRVGVMLYSGTRADDGATATTLLLPLDHYTTTSTVNAGSWYRPENIPAYLTISDSNSSPDVGIASGVRNSSKNRPTSDEREVVGATYIQRGLYDAWKEFEGVEDVKVPQGNAQAGVQRSPVIILMSDGRPTLATDAYNNVALRNSDYGNGTENTTSWETVFLTQLTAAWVKGAVADHYGTDAMFYTLGLGTGNDTYATGVLDPGSTTNNNVQTWWSNFQSGTNQNGSVLVEDNWGSYNDWYLTYDSDRFATGVGRNYTDGYWSASSVSDMISKFQEIIKEIGLQSAYSATLVESGDADLDGYITVQDELGAMMQVKDVKGIVLGNTYYSGAELARSLNSDELGSVDNPTAYGDEFVRTVKERLGITETSAAQQLIAAAYADGQLSHTSASVYSNYIGWYGDADNAYLGFWDKDTGLSAAGAPNGAKYINQSYGYLGDTEHGGVPSDMMHIVVMVRTEIATGHQTVLFRVPSALIPMVEYKVELEGDALEVGTEATLTVTENDPIRLVYEVGLPDDVNNLNIAQKVAQYEAAGGNPVHRDSDGNYVFYANSWDTNNDSVAPVISNLSDTEKLAITEYLPESHFIPNTNNERFYVLEDSVVYTKSGSNYTPVTSGINANGTYYFARNIVTIVNGTAQVVAQYEQLQPATVANSNNFQRNGNGQWEVKAGTIRQQLSNVILQKDENRTGTIANTDQLWVNVTSSDPSDYNIYSFLGNNGKFTVEPATGLKVTKEVTELADGAPADEEFEIRVLLDWEYNSDNVAALAVTDSEGNLLDDSNYAISASLGDILVILYLADGESAYITGVPGGTDYTVTEADHKKYTASYTGADVTVAGTIVEGTVTNEPVKPGNLNITKIVEHANGGMSFPTDYEFDFEVTFVDAEGNPIANTTFQLENNYEPTLTELTTDEDGVMTGKLRHGETVSIKGIPAGAIVTVEEVNIPANYTSTEYSSIDHSGDTPDADGEVTITAHANATVEVINTYTPDKVGVEIEFEGIKNFDATKMSADSEFTFKLQEYVNGKWTDVDGEVVTITGGTNAVEAFVFDALSLEFAEPGVHSYQIIEVKGENTDITYDRSVYAFSVNVTVDSNGDLQVEVVGYNQIENLFEVTGDAENGYTVTTVFNNQYHTTATSIEIVKSVTDKGNTGKTAAGFIIETYEATVDDASNWVQGDFIRSTVTDAEGEALLVRNYDNTDFEQNDGDGDNVVTYHFIIKEKAAGVAGWTYDATEYRVTVVLTKDDAGVITADFNVVKVDAQGNESDLGVSGDTATITFANTYDPKDTEMNLNLVPTVVKSLEGRDLVAGEFTFAIFKDGKAQFDQNGNLTNIDDAIATGTNDAEGKVAFSPAKLSFSEIGRYEYDIVEVKGSLGGVTYDSTIYDLVVEVSDNGDGTLKASYYFVDAVNEQVTFKNTYTAQPTEVVIEGLKTLKINSGLKALNAGDYTFGLYNEEDEKIGETTNLANGTFKFDAIEYTTADIGKTFTYTVKEVAPDGTTDGSYTAGGVKWSGLSFTVTVKVVDNGDGTLKTEVTGNGAENIEFVNEYSSIPVSVRLPGTKDLDGRDLVAGEFKFEIYKADSKFEDRELVTDQITHDVQGNITFNFGTLGMGYHYYVLKEVIPETRAAGVHYDASEYYVTIQVIDAGNGQMSYLTTVKHSGDPNAVNPAIAFNNIYKPEDGELILSGSKTYLGGKTLEDDVFSVGLYEGEELLQTANVKADKSFTFQALEYTADDVGKTYTYTVKEIIPQGATENNDGTFTSGNDIYDGTIYTVQVTITDTDKDGVLEITKTVTKDGAAAELSFTNTFVPDPIQHTLQAKKTYEKGLKGGDFEFKLVSADGKTDVDQTKENAANGDIIFDPITFTAAGEYKFKLTEKKEGIFSFIRPSEAEYEITVTVVNEDGVLRVSNVESVNTKNTNESNLEFINTYVIDGEDEITLRGTKTLTGDRTTVTEGEFEFGLYDADGELVEKVPVKADGTFEFSTLKFDETDVPVNGSKQITYTVKEIVGDNARYTYDDTIYTVVVTVKDNDQGGIEVSYTVNNVANGAITFENTYTNPTPVTYTPTAKKNYNRPLEGGEFKFKLEGTINGTDISDEKTNAAGGVITFETLSFPEAGTYTFTVKEIDKILGFIEYSAAEYEIVVKVIDTKGVLSIESVTINDDPNGTIEFTNTYKMDGEDEITLRGTKTLTGDRTTVTEGEFEFGLYDADGELVEKVPVKADGTFEFSTLKFDETDVPVNGSKQITYTVKEIAGTDPCMTYDETIYTVVVTVEDNDQGGVKVSYTINGKADGALAFTNTFTVPENVVANIYIQKNVINKSEPGIGLDGFEFVLEQQSGSTHSVTSNAEGKNGFQITFGYQDVGKTYTFKVYEKRGNTAGVTYDNTVYTVTVKVEQNPDGSIKTVINDVDTNAIALEFTNTYEKPETPVTGDNFPIIALGSLLVISGAAFLVLMLTKKGKGGKYAR